MAEEHGDYDEIKGVNKGEVVPKKKHKRKRRNALSKKR
jgi:hypothetical protein